MADDARGVESPVRQGDLDLPAGEHGGDDVVVGDDVALGVVDDAGAGTAGRGALRLDGDDGRGDGGGDGGPVGGVGGGGDGCDGAAVEVRRRGGSQHRGAHVEERTQGQADRQEHRAQERSPARALLGDDDRGSECLGRGRGRVSAVGFARGSGVGAAGRWGVLCGGGGVLRRRGCGQDVGRRRGAGGGNLRLVHGVLWCQFISCSPVCVVSSKAH